MIVLVMRVVCCPCGSWAGASAGRRARRPGRVADVSVYVDEALHESAAVRRTAERTQGARSRAREATRRALAHALRPLIAS